MRSILCLFLWHDCNPNWAEGYRYCARCGCKMPVEGSREERFLKEAYTWAAIAICMVFSVFAAALIGDFLGWLGVP